MPRVSGWLTVNSRTAVLPPLLLRQVLALLNEEATAKLPSTLPASRSCTVSSVALGWSVHSVRVALCTWVMPHWLKKRSTETACGLIESPLVPPLAYCSGRLQLSEPVGPPEPLEPPELLEPADVPPPPQATSSPQRARTGRRKARFMLIIFIDFVSILSALWVGVQGPWR